MYMVVIDCFLAEDQASRISPDGLIHDAERLKELVALPLERKIGITTLWV